MKVVILNHQIVRHHIASIHKAGCRDIEREALNCASVIYGPYDSVSDALADYIDPDMEEQGWSVSDVKIYPCCK